MEEFWAYEFLTLRNVSQAVIQNMKDDKIDCDAVIAMADENLKRYLPAYGDRIALMAFARIRGRSVNSVTPAMQLRREGAGTMPRGKHAGNKRAQKTCRRVEVGWFNMNVHTRIHKQVRSLNGGGTRHLVLPKSMTMEVCKQTAVELFFPNGNNKFGSVNEFHISLRDFKGDRLALALTVEEVFEAQHTKTMRLYLYTSRTDTFNPESTTSTEQQDNAPASNHNSTTSSSSTTSTEQLNNAPASNHSSTTSSSLPGISSDSEFEEAGTPTVLYRRRNNLSLRRRRPDHAVVQYTEEPRPLPAIDVIDSEDEALQMAIDASMADIQTPNRDRETMPLSHVLEQVQAQVDNSQQQEIVVNRRHVLDSALRSLRRANFNLSARMYVKFSGEMGLDHGGPRREFFRLALQELSSSSYFEGGEGNKFFAHNLQSLEKGDFKLIGNLVALSIVHDGPGLNTINSSLANMMLGLEAPLDTFNLDHLPNPEVKDILKQLKSIETPGDLDSFKADHGDWLIEQGYCGWRMRIEDKAEVGRSLLKQAILYRCSAEIEQCTSGLEEVFGLWSVMKAHAEICMPLLCYTPHALSKQEFMALFQPVYSSSGSNRRRDEEDTIYSWEMFLQDIDEKTINVTFEEVLVFVTGADRIPPCGFTTKIAIEFYSMEEGSKRLPFSSTCALSLSLPRAIADPGEFQPIIIRSLKESLGFEKM